MGISRVLASALLVVSITSNLHADDLPRHGVIGLALAAKDPTHSEDLNTNPPTVQAVVPGGAGEGVGFKAGDMVRSVDGTPIASSADFAMRIGRRLAGDQVSVAIVRDGQELIETVKLKPRPYETSPDANVLYRSVTVDGARPRVIVTKPKAAGRYPAVLLIAGLGCYSLDGELARPGGYGPILAALVLLG
jgi:hypothetical protein